jgi:gliding motility-associated-like protein
MKTVNYLLIVFGFGAQVLSTAQTKNLSNSTAQSSNQFQFWNKYADQLKLNKAEKQEFLNAHNNSTQHSHSAKLIPYNFNPQNTQASTCVNIDFESGNLSGWTSSSGFHPIFNPLGCCLNPGGSQLVVNAGIDPAGGFQRVAPGGNFSLLLGDNGTGGEADRVEQTFLVNAFNANFTYRYAVVFQDPGHVLAQQPSFQIEMLDSSGVQIPCTFYNVAAGNNIPGFQNSPTLNGVIYKNWTNVSVDLTNYIGQNVTIRFTTYDCALGGHYGYAYIDGICAAFVKGGSDTVCAGTTKNFCAPNGFMNYTWNGPNASNVIGQCFSALSAGVYTCQTQLVTGCTGPEFTYTLVNFPQPNASFTYSTANACALNYSVTNTSTISSGNLSYTWNVTPVNNNLIQPIFGFAAPGNYSLQLNVSSNQGCLSSTSASFNIAPLPVTNFIANNVCLNSTTQFTNQSNISTGNIASYNWVLNSVLTSTLTNPSVNYLTPGIYTVQLQSTSNVGCSTAISKTVQVYYLPNMAFASSSVCQGVATQFTNNCNVADGTLTTFNWDFNHDGIYDSNVNSPTYIYPSFGNYTVNLQATSSYNCVNTITSSGQVFANPTASFIASPVCFGNTTTFTNQTSIPVGSVISYAWSLGNNTSFNGITPAVNYNSGGVYTVQLTATSNNNCNAFFTSTVLVHHLPTNQFTNNIACLNQTTQFNNSSSVINATITKYRWDFENDGIWDDTLAINPSKLYPNYGNFNCKLQTVSNFNCARTVSQNVIVHANPVANFTTNKTCFGDGTKFTNLSTSADGLFSSYQWDFNSDNTIDNIFPSPTTTYVNTGVHLVKLEVQTEYGCTNVIVKPVFVNAVPVTNFSAPKMQGCPSFCTKFTNLSTISNGNIVTSQWQFGDGSLPIYQLNPTHCYTTGKYDVTLIAVSDSGCINKMVKPNFITVYPTPIASFYTEPEEIDENEPNVAILSNATGALATSYHINDGANYYSDKASHVFAVPAKQTPVIFQVVKNEYGCSDTISKVLKFKPSFVVYIPNAFTPNGDGVNDDFFAKGVGINKFTIQIYDRWGHLVFTGNSLEETWDGTMKNTSDPIKQDVYVWKAQVVDIFNKYYDLTGHVSLIK